MNDDEFAPLNAASGERNLRAAFRTFARRNHPDRGGDADVFARGAEIYRSRIEALSQRRRTAAAAPTVVAFRSRGMRRKVRRWLAQRRHDRFDRRETR